MPTGRIGKVAYQVARDIVEDITSARTPSGTVLPSEAEMIKQYGVSRASMREALRILEVLGLIVMKTGPGGGPVVSSVQSNDFAAISALFFQFLGATYRDLFEARRRFEPIAARLAAERRTDAQVEQLRHYLEDMQAVDVGNDLQFRDAGRDIHTALSVMSANPVIDIIVRSNIDTLNTFSDRVTRGYPTRNREHVHAVHAELARAVIAGNSKEAERLMAEHLDDYETTFLSTLGDMVDEIVRW